MLQNCSQPPKYPIITTLIYGKPQKQEILTISRFLVNFCIENLVVIIVLCYTTFFLLNIVEFFKIFKI